MFTHTPAHKHTLYNMSSASHSELWPTIWFTSSDEKQWSGTEKAFFSAKFISLMTPLPKEGGGREREKPTNTVSPETAIFLFTIPTGTDNSPSPIPPVILNYSLPCNPPIKPQQFHALYTSTLKRERVRSICLQQDYTVSQYEQSPQWKPQNLYQYNLCGDETSQGCVRKGRSEQIWQNTSILLYWRLMCSDFSRT